MPLFDMVDRRRLVQSAMHAEVVPSDFGDIVSSAYDHMNLNLVSNAADNAYNLAMDDMLDPLFDGTDTTPTASMQRSNLFYNKHDEGINSTPINFTQVRYASARADLLERGKEVPTWGEIVSSGEQRANDSTREFQQAQAYTTSNSARSAVFLGSAGATMQDPLVMASILLTLPLGMTTTALRVAAVEAAVSGAAEIPIQMQVKAWHDQRGLDYTVEDAATAVLFATALPAALVGGMSKVYKAMGGTNTRMFEGPAYDLQQIKTLYTDNLKHTLSLDDAGKKFVARVDSGDSSSFSHSFEIDTPAIGMDTRRYGDILYRQATLAAPAARGDALILAMGEHLGQINPARGAVEGKLAKGAEIDTLTYTFARTQMNDMQQANLAQAIHALQKGELPAPPFKHELSVELSTGAKDITHVQWARDIRRLENEDIVAGRKRGAFVVDPGNTKFNEYINNLMLQQLEPKLKILAGKAELPPAPKVAKPRMSMDTVTKKQKAAADDIASAELQLNRGPQKAHITKQLTGRVDRGLASLEKLGATQKQHRLHDTYLLGQEKVKAATSAARDLDALRRGNVPPAYKFLRDSVAESVVKFAKDRKYMDDVAMSAGAERVMRFNGNSHADWRMRFSDATHGMPTGDALKALTRVTEPPVEAARYAEFKRLDGTMEFAVGDGEIVTVQKILDDHADMDSALLAAKECTI